jgi:phospholipid transport system substrate-binding protein
MNAFRNGLASAAAAAITFASAGAPAARAEATDPAAQQIDALDQAVLEAMRAGKSVTTEARYRQLEPVVTRTFDTPTMIRFAVGPTWPQIPPAQQQALTTAFRRLTVASYAKNFDSYSGQKFVVSPNVVTRGPDKVVSTQILSPGNSPTSIAYRMRQSGDTWKVIDVYYNNSISQLTTRRSDFASTLSSGGPTALLAHINALVDKEMK